MLYMKKMLKKIVPILVLSAVIILVGGFFDGPKSSAQITDKALLGGHVIDGDRGAMIVVTEEQAPLNNSLMPCCENRHSATPTTEGVNFNASVKFAAMDLASIVPNSNLFFENKISDISGTSPPKPDVLSSVLKRE